MIAFVLEYTKSFPVLSIFYNDLQDVIITQIIANNKRRNEPRHKKTDFLHNAKTKTHISFAVTAKLISASPLFSLNR